MNSHGSYRKELNREMKIIDQFFNDPLFINWIFKSNPELDSYWNEYLEQNPELSSELVEIKTKCNKIKFKKKFLSDEEKQELAISIYRKLLKEKKNLEFSRKIKLTLKYAAFAILFFSLGGIVVYLNTNKNDIGKYITQIESPHSVKSPTLILPEGRNVQINKGKSTLDYLNPDEIILNNDSVISINNEASRISQLVIPHGSSSRIVLGDSTVVWLNAGSSLIYPSKFGSNNREVVLFGEAFFDVAKISNKPFVVQTTALEITVLGTRFNISAYPEDRIIQTVLEEGSVAVRKINRTKSDKEIILRPNQLISYDKSTKLSEVTEVNTEFYTSWTNGLLSFENRDLNRVVKAVERYYDITIQFDDPLLGAVKISGKLDLTQGKSEVFEYLEKVSSTTFVQTGENYYKINREMRTHSPIN